MSYIPTANAPIRIDVQEGHNQVVTESRKCVKRGRPIGSKDKNPRKTKKDAENETEVHKTPDMAAADPAHDVAPSNPTALDMAGPDATDVAGPDVPNNDSWDAKIHGTDGADNNEISINYVLSGKQWNRKHVDMDDIFAYEVSLELMDNACNDQIGLNGKNP